MPLLAHAEAIPLPEASVDGVVVEGSWNQFPDPQAVVDDLFQSPRFRWAKPLVDRGIISQGLVENFTEAVRPMKVGELRGVKTSDGREIRCHSV